MTIGTVELDERRGMAAQKATEIRRQIAGVAADGVALRARQEALELQLLAGPAASWVEAAEKAVYLLQLFAATTEARDRRRQTLITHVLADFERLARRTGD